MKNLKFKEMPLTDKLPEETPCGFDPWRTTNALKNANISIEQMSEEKFVKAVKERTSKNFKESF